jgi:hypothetical protein
MESASLALGSITSSAPPQPKSAFKHSSRDWFGPRFWSTSCSYSWGKSDPPLLEQFQGLILTLFPQVSLPGVTRISLGIENNAEEIDTLIEVLSKIARQSRAQADNPFASTQSDFQKQMDVFVGAVAQRVYT